MQPVACSSAASIGGVQTTSGPASDSGASGSASRGAHVVRRFHAPSSHESIAVHVESSHVAPPLRDLDIDHVMPRSRGGLDTWENLVTACRVCNLRKGWRTPDEAGMRLLRVPVRPRWTTTAQILLEAREQIFCEWEPFLKAG